MTAMVLPNTLKTEVHPGLYHGEIRNAEDPEKRRRYRVRVHAVHPQSVSDDSLPWAESAVVGGKFWGDWPGYEVGDRVIVGFHGGDAYQPIILAGWVNASADLLDTPPDLATRYAEGRKRWVRVDRAGNMLELSAIEHWARLVAGAAAVIVRSDEQSIELVAGTHMRTGRIARDRIVSYVLNAEDALIDVEAYDTLGGSTGIATILSNLDVYMKAYRDFVIGLYVHSFLGQPTVPPVMEQGERAIIGAQYIFIGSPIGESIGPGIGMAVPPTLPTTEITITATGPGGSIKVLGDLGASITVQAVGNVSIQSSATVSVEAPAVTIKSADIQMTT
jgi:hypothetical protein